MGFLDLFVKNENEGTTPTQAAPVTTSVGQSLQPQQVAPQVQYNASAPIPGTVDSKFMKHFEAILEKANIPGARIKHIYDLAQMGLAWNPAIKTTPQFHALIHEIETLYPTL